MRTSSFTKTLTKVLYDAKASASVAHSDLIDSQLKILAVALEAIAAVALEKFTEFKLTAFIMDARYIYFRSNSSVKKDEKKAITEFYAAMKEFVDVQWLMEFPDDKERDDLLRRAIFFAGTQQEKNRRLSPVEVATEKLPSPTPSFFDTVSARLFKKSSGSPTGSPTLSPTSGNKNNIPGVSSSFGSDSSSSTADHSAEPRVLTTEQRKPFSK